MTAKAKKTAAKAATKKKSGIRWVTLGELVAETGYAIRSLQYIRQSEPNVLQVRQKGSLTQYKQPDCAINLRMREKNQIAPDQKKVQDMKDRRIEAETRKAELELAQLEGSLIPLTDYETRLAVICERVRSVMVTIPSKYMSKIVAAKTQVDAQGVGEAIRDETLIALQSAGEDVDADIVEAVEDDVT